MTDPDGYILCENINCAQLPNPKNFHFGLRYPNFRHKTTWTAKGVDGVNHQQPQAVTLARVQVTLKGQSNWCNKSKGGFVQEKVFSNEWMLLKRWSVSGCSELIFGSVYIGNTELLVTRGWVQTVIGIKVLGAFISRTSLGGSGMNCWLVLERYWRKIDLSCALNCWPASTDIFNSEVKAELFSF